MWAKLRRFGAAARLQKHPDEATRQLTRREAWAAHKAARRKRRKAETLLGRITGLPRSWRAYLTGWVVMHPAAETKAKRTPVRRRFSKAAERVANRRAVRANRVPRGRLTNPTALR